ncbi:5,10-methylenetetrahydrofolate reductase [Subtercola boreus]|nr:5,10-methylenetetrahydrofolate reductase [Subtercola boreus]
MFSCPKAMEYGPCGGVHDDGSCEVSPDPCVFLQAPARLFDGVHRRDAPPLRPEPAPLIEEGRLMVALLEDRPVIMSDFPIRAAERAAMADGAAVLRHAVDAVLIGEPPSVSVQFAPAYRVQLLKSFGLDVWTSVNCRDRNRVALEGELAALADAGVSGVHCITGDHTLLGRRPEAMPVFDLDSTQLAALARARGLLVSVAESPDAPPRGTRPARYAQKVLAGAQVCFINICSGAETVREFIRAARAEGAGGHFIPCVPFIVDEGSAAIMTGLSSHVLPAGYIERIMGSLDPRAEGIRAAVELSLEFLAVDGISGVCLSGGGTRGGELEYAGAMAEAAVLLRSRLAERSGIA